MQPMLNDDNWNIVVAGQWNARVFSPAWVGSQLLGDPQLQVVAQLLPGGPNLQYQSGNVGLYPSDEAFMVVARRQTEEALRRVEAVVLRALRLLEHTPVVGVGINFTQVDPQPSEQFLQLLSSADEAELARFGYLVRHTEIARQIVIHDRVVNVRQAISEAGHAVISLNFHFDVRSATQAADVLEGQTVACRDVAAAFLHNAYDMTLTTEDSHEPV